jgi:hypothetical protein
MKQALIVALVCLNLALLVAVVSVTTTPAQAQAVGGRGDYLLINCEIARGEDVIYVIDTASRRMAVIRYSVQNGRIVPVSMSDLARDFGRQ